MLLRICAGLLVLLLVRAPAQSAEEPRQVFDEAWRLVRTEFYDPNLHGLDWERVGEKYRALAAAASDTEELSAVIDTMLNELGASHTGHFTPEEVAYYDLFDIFGNRLRAERERLFPGGRVTYVGIGAATQRIDGRIFVSGILEGYPAAQAGLRMGDEVVSVEDAPFHPIRSFRGKAGQPVIVEVRRKPDAQLEAVMVTPREIRPGEAYLDAMRASARIIERDGAKIGYIRVWSYAGYRYQELLEEELSTGRMAGADALIWDLRGGWGGAQLSYLDVFDRSGPTMTMIGRDGERELIGFRWHRPVAMLVDSGTRSGKEILAHGMKTRGLGEVIGQRTAGAVLAGSAFILSDGSLLLLAVADVLVDGERLEGRGVAPTIEVPHILEYSEGRDPQLDRALDELMRSIRS